MHPLKRMAEGHHHSSASTSGDFPLPGQLMKGESLLFSKEVFAAQNQLQKVPLFLPYLFLWKDHSLGLAGRGGGAVGWGEREERRVHSFTPQMLSPPPLPIFLGKLSCSNLAHAIKLTEQCLFEVFWDCEMFKGTLAERGPEVGSPKFPSPSHPLILGIRKSSLPK